MTIKRKQRLTLFQLWLEDRGRKAIGCFGPTAKENSGDRIAPLAKRPTRKKRKLARILKVYVPKQRRKRPSILVGKGNCRPHGWFLGDDLDRSNRAKINPMKKNLSSAI